MTVDVGVKHPRRLVVNFGVGWSDMIETDDGDRPQLVYHQDRIEKPSRFIRFATRLGLTKRDKPMMNAVKETHAFVSGNCRQGDQVTLLVNSQNDRNLDAAEMLAKHLHDGTRPGNLSKVPSKNVGNLPPGQIPTHCVAVGVRSAKSSISEWNNQLKSRFPTGIEHIICWAYWPVSRSCATRYDADGSMISREICIPGDDRAYELRWHCTKHVIYYEEDMIPEWDNHKPVWTHKFNSPPSDVQCGLPLEATKPFGMHVHELRKYQGVPGFKESSSVLVWKSYRSTSEHT